MTTPLPTITVNNSIELRQNIRNEWDSLFETNHLEFVNKLAQGIALKAVSKLKATLEDPFARTVNADNKAITKIQLEITGSNAVNKLKQFLDVKKLKSPFHEWMQKYTSGNEQNNYMLYGRDGDDQEYFEARMNIVGRLVQQRLTQLMTDFVSRPPHSELKFQVEWYGSDEMHLKRTLDFKSKSGFGSNKNSIIVSLWHQNRTTTDETTESNTIVLHRAHEQKFNRSIRSAFITSLIVLIGMVYLHTYGYIQISQNNH